MSSSAARALILVVLLASPACARVIRHIEIVRNEVFDAGDLPFSLHKTANWIHAVTVESVIRRDLLFREGEELDTALVAETARLVRSRRYINDVAITVTEVGPDSADILVETRDLWSLEISANASGGGGAYAVSFEIAESNFRGRAQEIALAYSITDRRSAGHVSLTEPAMFGSHIRGWFAFTGHGEGHRVSTGLHKPIWATTIPWQWGLAFGDSKDNFLFWKQGQSAFQYPLEATSVNGELARGWGRRTRMFVGGRMSWSRQDWGEIFVYDSIPPATVAESCLFQIPDQVRVVPSISVRLVHQNFHVGRFLDRYGRIEDFPTTMAVGFRVGHVSKALGSSVDRLQLGGDVQGGLGWGMLRTNLDLRVAWESDYEASEGATQVSARARLYLSPVARHTLAFNATRDGWYRANYFGQMFLGALSGVRGLPARWDDGTQRWTANAEYRYFSPLSVLTIGLGGVLFADAGRVWNPEKPEECDQPLRHRSDAVVTYGFGLRLGFPRIANERVFRWDFARGPEGWITTFGIGMYFDFNLANPLRF